MSKYKTITQATIVMDGKNISKMFTVMGYPKDDIDEETFLDVKPEYINYFKDKHPAKIDIVIYHVDLLGQEFVSQKKYYYVFSNVIPERMYLFECNLNNCNLYEKVHEFDKQRNQIREILDSMFLKKESENGI